MAHKLKEQTDYYKEKQKPDRVYVTLLLIK